MDDLKSWETPLYTGSLRDLEGKSCHGNRKTKRLHWFTSGLHLKGKIEAKIDGWFTSMVDWFNFGARMV